MDEKIRNLEELSYSSIYDELYSNDSCGFLLFNSNQILNFGLEHLANIENINEQNRFMKILAHTSYLSQL